MKYKTNHASLFDYVKCYLSFDLVNEVKSGIETKISQKLMHTSKTTQLLLIHIYT